MWRLSCIIQADQPNLYLPWWWSERKWTMANGQGDIMLLLVKREEGTLAQECRHSPDILQKQNADVLQKLKNARKQMEHWSLQKRLQPWRPLDFSPVRPIMDFWLTDCRIISLCYGPHCVSVTGDSSTRGTGISRGTKEAFAGNT